MKIVLLPGLDGTGALFAPLIESLPKSIDTIVISYPSKVKMDYDELVDFVINKLPKTEKFILIGESFSGPIAYQIALQKPENLKSVIFVATFLENPRPLLLNLIKFLPLSLLISLPIPEFIIRLFIFKKNSSTELIKLFRKSLNQVAKSILSFRLREITRLHKQLSPCNIQAIYIQASNDMLVPSKSIEIFNGFMNNLNVYKVNGSHFILQTNPSACMKIILTEMRR